MNLYHVFEPPTDSPDATLSTFQHGVCDGVEGLGPCDDPFVGDCE